MVKLIIRIIFVLTIALTSNKVYAQNPDTTKTVNPQTPNRVFKTNPLRVLWGPIPFTSEFRLVVEQTIHPKQSFLLGLSYLGKSPFIYLIEDSAFRSANSKIIIRGFRVQVAHVYYPSKQTLAPNGFYISPSISISSAKLSNHYAYKNFGYYVNAVYYNASVLTGYQLIFDDNIAIDMFLGLGYQEKIWTEHNLSKRFFRVVDNDEIGVIFKTPIKITLGFNVGFAF